MKKTYCDICEKEIKDHNSVDGLRNGFLSETIIEGQDIVVGVTVTVLDENKRPYDCCPACVINLVETVYNPGRGKR